MKNIGHFSARLGLTSLMPLMPHAAYVGVRRACHRLCHFSLIAAAALALAACVSNVPAPVEGRGGYGAGTQQAGEEFYTVQSGDTLYSIARAHNLDPRELIALNQLENANQISVGRIIRLRPHGAETAATDAVTGVETQPITDNQGIEQRALGGAGTDSAAGGAVFAGSDAGGSTGLLKREPKAGKEPYSEQALAQAQGPALPRMPDAAAAAAATTAGAAQSAEGGRQGAEAAADTAAHGQTWIWPASGAVLGHFGNGNKGVDVSGKHGDPVIAAQDGKVIIANNALRGYGNMVIIKHADNLVSVYAHNSKLLVKEGQQVSKGQKIAEMGNTDADRVKLHFEIRTQGRPVDPMKYLPAR